MSLALDNIVAAAVLIGIRVSSLLIFTPFLGSLAISARVKAGFVMATTFLLWPAYAPAGMQTLSSGSWARIAIGEVLIGLVLGLLLNFIFDGAQLAGQIMGLQMGFSLVNVIDPQTEVDSPVLSIFHQTIALLIFLQLDVHHWVLRGVARSFEYLPAGTLMASAPLTSLLLKAAAGIWLAGLQIAAPTLIATMFADIVLGFLAKASPNFPILFIGISVKSLLGFLVIACGLKWWPTVFERYFGSAIAMSEHILRLR